MSYRTYTQREIDFINLAQRKLHGILTHPKRKQPKEKLIVKMCKNFVVMPLAKGHVNKDGSLKGMTNGSSYTLTWWSNEEDAQTKADEHARAGLTGIIFEAKEFRQIQPAPVVVERVTCCDPERK